MAKQQIARWWIQGIINWYLPATEKCTIKLHLLSKPISPSVLFSFTVNTVCKGKHKTGA